MAFSEQNKYEQALSDLDHAIEMDQHNSVYYFNRAIVRYKSGNLNGTMEDYNKVLELNPDNALTYFNRAILNSEIGKTKEAIDDYSKAIELNPKNILPYFNRGGIKFESKDYYGAIEDWSQAIEIFPDFAKAYQARSSARYMIKDYSGAMDDEKTAKKKIEEYQQKHGKDSLLADFADTSYNFKKVIEFDDDFYRANMEDGEVQNKRVVIDLKPILLLTVKQPFEDNEVISLYLPSIEELNRKKPMGFDFVISNSLSKFEVDSVRTLLNQTEQAKIASNLNQYLYFYQGLLNSMVQNYNQSIKAYSAAIAIDPKFELAYFNRANTRYLMIEYVNSLEEFAPVIAIKGDKAAAQTEVKQSTENDYSGVIDDLNSVIELNPKFGIAYYNRGNVKCLSKDFTGAIDDYTQSIQTGPVLPQAYFNRGLTLIYLQDKEKGCYDISKAGELGIEEAYAVIKKYCGKK